MPSLPRGLADSERVVLFPCQGVKDMDRFLLLVDPRTGELLQDMLVGEQFLRAGFECVMCTWDGNEYGRTTFLIFPR